MNPNVQADSPAASWALDTEASSPGLRVETLNGVERRTNVEVHDAHLTAPEE